VESIAGQARDSASYVLSEMTLGRRQGESIVSNETHIVRRNPELNLLRLPHKPPSTLITCPVPPWRHRREHRGSRRVHRFHDALLDVRELSADVSIFLSRSHHLGEHVPIGPRRFWFHPSNNTLMLMP